METFEVGIGQPSTTKKQSVIELSQPMACCCYRIDAPDCLHPTTSTRHTDAQNTHAEHGMGRSNGPATAVSDENTVCVSQSTRVGS